jgi:signal transduction histidine kinase
MRHEMLGKLAQQFTWISLAAITCVGLTLLFFEYRQNLMFHAVQTEQVGAVERIQSEFMRQAQAVAMRDLVAVQEGANANISRLIANSLWRGEIAPLIAEADALTNSCPARRSADNCTNGRRVRLENLRTLGRLDKNVRALIQHTAVLKVKVYDLRGITVYSSDPEQIGEDQSFNPGIQNALGGRATSELEYRDSFNTFEGLANKVDVIGTYLPLRVGEEDRIVAVIETYSDVTPFVRQIEETTAAYTRAARANQEQIEARGAATARQVLLRGVMQAIIVAVLLAALFALLLAVVRRAQRIADKQVRERDAAKRHLAHTEKMRALGQMVAGVAHQLNTPLAFSRSNVEMVRAALNKLHPLPAPLIVASEMLDDVMIGIDQMNELVRKLRDFTRLDREPTDSVDLREALGSVVYIARAVMSTKIRIIESYTELPKVNCNVSKLNHAFLNIIMNAAQAIQGEGVITITATSDSDNIEICIRDTGPGIPDDVLPHIFEPHFTTKPPGEGTGLGLSIAADAVADHGGSIRVETQPGAGTAFFIALPAHPARGKHGAAA